jgi:hypothetical protein
VQTDSAINSLQWLQRFDVGCYARILQSSFICVCGASTVSEFATMVMILIKLAVALLVRQVTTTGAVRGQQINMSSSVFSLPQLRNKCVQCATTAIMQAKGQPSACTDAMLASACDQEVVPKIIEIGVCAAAARAKDMKLGCVSLSGGGGR